MGKIFKDAFEKYGEAKPPTQDKYSSNYGKVGPDYKTVQKALRIRRALWMVPSGLGLLGIIWLTSFFGEAFFLGFLMLLGICAGIGAIIVVIAFMVHLSEETGEILTEADKLGVRESIDG